MTKDDVQAAAERTIVRVMNKPRNFPPARGLSTYDPRATDVIVTTFPKSGTTLTQQLAYQVVVATGGAAGIDPDGLNFADICEAAPYIDYGPEHNFHARETSPRVFKSHSVPAQFPSRVQKHILVFRDPCSYPASCLDFLYDALCGECVTDLAVREAAFHMFITVRLLGKPLSGGTGGFGFPYEKDEAVPALTAPDQLPVGPWFLHAKAWVNALRPGVIVLFYEDIVKDMAAAAHSVAKFIGRELNEDGVKHVMERCDRAYMSSDVKFKCTMESEVLGFGPNAWKSKPESRDGFKQFKIKAEDVRGVNARFQQEFSVPDYSGFIDMVKRKAREVAAEY